MKRNPYEILGVDPGADKSEIKAAYKTLAQSVHPDKGGDQNEFTELQWAYAILKDDDKRAHWDRTGEDNSGQPSTDDMATSEILGAFQQCLQMVLQGRKSENTDCVEEITTALRDAVSQGKNQINEVSRHLQKVEKMLGKFTVDNNQPNVFEGHLSSVKGSIETKLGNLKGRQTVLEKAEQQIKHFTYSPEGGLVKQASQGFHMGGTGSTSTTNAWG
ncbi:MAG: hypothetical protein C0610_16760 [Desulfobacteraceae bacterium]|nr:MAG: hypothetical protein C0610_16760 [Desulfobacteraceae bacterium]